MKDELLRHHLSPLAVKSISTIELKKDEPLIAELHTQFSNSELHIYKAEELADISVPNPSEKVKEVTGVDGVAESSAIRASDYGRLLMEKQKRILSEGNNFTFAVALSADSDRNNGHIEIVGAGPGDPELISVRGKRMLEKADLILYAGSLVPRELTYYAKPGATVRSSADMTLEEQFTLMKSFYDKGLFVVRLHTGDPCIYGAIAEQMAFFDQYGMRYHITPGISSFQAAAAALKSQFTILKKCKALSSHVERVDTDARERKTSFAGALAKHDVHLSKCCYCGAGTGRTLASLLSRNARSCLLQTHLERRKDISRQAERSCSNCP